MKQKKIVMFDYDGVIVDSFKIHYENFKMACQENGFFGIDSPEKLLSYYDSNIYEALLKEGVDAGMIDRIIENYTERQEKFLDHIPLFPGMKECLDKLVQEAWVVIITSNASSAVEYVLRANGVSPLEVLGAEKEKSKEKKIRKVLQDKGNAKAFYVGDTVGDILEGKKAGVLTVGVSWGWHGPERLVSEKPDFMAYATEELLEIVVGC